MHQRGAFAERQRHVLQRNDGFCHGKSALYWREGLRVVSHIWVGVDGFQTRSARFSGGWFRCFFPAVAAIAEPYRIVGFGDSLMAGFGLNPGEGFTEKLQAALKAKGTTSRSINAGVSGDTTSGGLSRLDWSVPDGTQLVILELGANDMLRGITPDISREEPRRDAGQAEAAQNPRAARRHARRAQSRRRLPGGVRRDLPAPCRKIRRCRSTRSSWTASLPTRS